MATRYAPRLIWGKYYAIAAIVLAGVLSIGLAGFASNAASAHVTVNPSQAPKGGYSVVTFRVPNEDDNATTVKLEVLIDASTPIPNARIKPVPGWEAKVETRPLDKPLTSHHGQYTEGVSRITWTAQSGAGVKPGEFMEFDVSFGPLPNADRIPFKALQTYDNNKVVRWIDTNPEADNPAPVLTLVKAADDHHGEDVSRGSDDDDTDAVAVIAVIAGGLGLVLGVVALVIALRSGRRNKELTAAKSADDAQ